MRFFFTLSLFALSLGAQDLLMEDMDDDLDIGGDIFTDFNEELEMTQIQEDERFWRYGRFFSLYLGLGLTSFDGNRGLLYREAPPGYSFGFYYFRDFQSAFGMGLQYTQHHFSIDRPVFAYASNPLGFVEVTAPPFLLGLQILYRHHQSFHGHHLFQSLFFRSS